MQLIKGTTVTVQRRAVVSTDSHNNPVYSDWQNEAVDNVLVQYGSTSDLDAKRPVGVKVAMTFHFPKTYMASLMGCRICYGERIYSVIGDPLGYMSENTPSIWNRPVECEAFDG